MIEKQFALDQRRPMAILGGPNLKQEAASASLERTKRKPGAMEGPALRAAPRAVRVAPPPPERGRSAGHTSSRDPGARTLVALSLALAAVAILTKLLLLPLDVETASQLARWLLRLAIVVSADLCFVVGLALVCGLVSKLIARWVRLGQAWRIAIFVIYGASAAYSVASVPMLRTLLAPFSIRLIVLAGGPLMMTSSVLQHVSPALVAGIFAAVAGVVAAPRLLSRCRWLSAPARRPWLAAAVAALLASGYGGASQAYIKANWTQPKRWERRISQNPHMAMIASCLVELAKPEPFTQPFFFSEIDDSDFRAADRKRAAPVAQRLAAGERPQNIILVVLESTAAQYMSLYGSSHPTTPKLEKLAAEQGVVYENAYAQAPASWKSLIGLLASTYCRPDWRMIVEDCPDFDVPTLPEVLARHGFRNCFLHAGYWDWRGGAQFLERHGVQELVDAYHLPAAPLNSWGTSDRIMFQASLDWIDGHRDRPFFVCACTIETHHPYARGDRPIDFKTSDPDFNRYLNALRRTDDNIAWLIEELRRRGLADSTLVAVTADHGENFGQHDQRVHGFDLYEPGIHVPLVLLHRSLATLPRRDRQVRQHIDLPVTLLDLLGIEVPAEWQGSSMLTQGGERRAYFYAVADQVVLGLRDGPYKYHYYVDTGYEELFDLRRDPGELRNLAPQHADFVAQLRRRVGGFVAYQRQFLAQHGGHQVAAGLRLTRQKKGIGYDTTGRFRSVE